MWNVCKAPAGCHVCCVVSLQGLLWVVTMVFQFQEMKSQCTMTPWSPSWSYGLLIARRPWRNCGTAFVSTTWATWHPASDLPLCISPAECACRGWAGFAPLQLICTGYPYVNKQNNLTWENFLWVRMGFKDFLIQLEETVWKIKIINLWNPIWNSYSSCR